MPALTLIANANSIMRQGLYSILYTLPSIANIKSVNTVKEVIKLCEQQYPDMAIIDLDSMSEEGFKIVEKLHEYNNKIGIIILLRHYKSEEILRLIRCGASAFLSINCELTEIKNAVEIVLGGGSLMNHILTHVITNLAFRHLIGNNRHGKTFLTKRENEVLEMIIDGMAIQNIARELNLSIHTVYTHKRNIKEKLNVSNDVQLTKNVLSQMSSAGDDGVKFRPAALSA